MKYVITAALLFLSITAAAAVETFPQKDITASPNPLASPYAVPGGEMVVYAGPYPKSFNYYLDNNAFTSEIFDAMFETLISADPVTAEYMPGLADRWTISDDKKVFTFYLNKKAMWSDGTPITAHDVKWTFDTVVDPKNLTGPHKVALEVFSSPKVIDDETIQFTAKEVHWRNLGAAGTFHILSKKAYSDKDFNKLNFEFPVVSGPYKLGEIREGIYADIVKRKDWWSNYKPFVKGTGNFDTLKFKFYAERENAFEDFKKGGLDVFPVYTSRIWINETKGDKFDKNWIVKQKIHNYHPIGFQGFAMNMRKPPFDDILVRKAMAYLLNRPKMNETLMYNQYFLHKSYFEDLYSSDHPCKNELIPFDKEEARKLLKQAGWKVNPTTGLLEKNGHILTFNFLARDSTAEKFLAIFMEDLKDVGIEMKIDMKDWAAWLKDMDDFNYQMTWAAWSSSLYKDPEGMWSSKEADRKGGNNITGFKDKKVDELIEAQKQIFDLNKRNDIVREVDKIIYDACPYVLLWNIDYVRLLYWNKFGMPDTVLSKYGDESASYWYWWKDEDLNAELTDAMEQKLSLPRKEPGVSFDQVFTK